MSETTQLVVIGLLLAFGLASLIVMWKSNRRQPITARLEALSGHDDTESLLPQVFRSSRESLPKIIESLSPTAGAARQRLKSQLLHAGLYGPTAMTVFLGVKLSLMLLPVALGLIGGLVLAFPLGLGLRYGTLGSSLGLFGPSLWLRYRKSGRQVLIRRAIPDFLDVVVICLDAGLSFQAALQRVVGELEGAFPLLTFELNIVLREIQLNVSTGEALRNFAERVDMEECRNLAAVVIQSERYGASLTKALHVHARALRIKRSQKAEEQGQKASVQVLFPTILFIFPALFIVILGPAMVQISAMLAKMKTK